MTIPPQTRAAVIDGLSRAVGLYIDPAMSARLAGMLAERRERYLSAGDPDELASMLTGDLRALSGDKHLTVRYDHERWLRASTRSPAGADDAAVDDAAVDDAAGNGFSSLSRLPGNIGFLDLRGFSGNPSAASLIDCAMRVLGHTDAMIIDLRKNHGGAGEPIAALAGYFLGKRQLLVHLFRREPTGRITKQDTYSLPPPAGRAYQAPVYILTSSETFSAAEEFAYDLKTLGRATIVGETTGGGAHPVTIMPIGQDFTAMIPIGRVEGAATGTDWEGVGVVPDMPVPAQSALLAAYTAALTKVQPHVHGESLDHDLAQARSDPAAALSEAR